MSNLLLYLIMILTLNSFKQEAKGLENIWNTNDENTARSILQTEFKSETNSPIFLSFEKGSIDKNGKIIKLSIHEKKSQVEVGYIFFYLKVGIPKIIGVDDPITIKNNPPKSALLFQIAIHNQYQGKGYSSAALDIFHNFLDKIGTEFTVLTVESTTPYAGAIYKKKGYVFTPKTIDAITSWGKQQDILSESEAEAKFLEDTTQSLGTDIVMIRYKNQIPSDATIIHKNRENFSLKNSTFLTVISMSGFRIPIPYLEGETIKDVKKQVAEVWNKEHNTNFTFENITLAGNGALVSGSSKFKKYEDMDVISREALRNEENRNIYVTIHRHETVGNSDNSDKNH